MRYRKPLVRKPDAKERGRVCSYRGRSKYPCGPVVAVSVKRVWAVNSDEHEVREFLCTHHLVRRWRGEVARFIRSRPGRHLTVEEKRRAESSNPPEWLMGVP